jgi:hypothetical protein
VVLLLFVRFPNRLLDGVVVDGVLVEAGAPKIEGVVDWLFVEVFPKRLLVGVGLAAAAELRFPNRDGVFWGCVADVFPKSELVANGLGFWAGDPVVRCGQHVCVS